MDDPDDLGRVMAFPVTASLGPAGPLLRQLRSPTTVQNVVSEDEIQRLRKELDGLSVSLMHQSEAEEPLSFTAKCWMREVRELCYDTKNYMDDDALLTPEEKQENAQFEFKMLEARAKNANGRRQRYKIDHKSINKQPKLLSVGRMLPVVHRELMRGRMDKLADMLHNEKVDRLKVVSLVGLEGTGKTTLARSLYHQVQRSGQFECGAFVRVSPNPDMRRLLTTIFTQIQLPYSVCEGVSQPACCLDAQSLIANIKHYLQHKRYFIILDDLWSISVWDIIRRAFPDVGCHSTIITTTQIQDVASACCSYQSKYIIKMEPLEDYQSRKLFFSVVFGSEDAVSFPGDFEEVQSEIIEKCGGLPLSIVNIASMLPEPSKRNLQELMGIRDSLPSTLRANPTSEGIKQVVKLIYNNLSPELKTCLLYLVVNPEGYTVSKDDLVKQWVIEGFIREGQNKEEIAGGYFDELVRRGMVQAVDIDYRGVQSCTLQHMVHDLIVTKSIEENFVCIVDCFQSGINLPEKVRRLSVHFGGARSARIPTGIMVSEVRSLAFFGFYGCMDFIKECELLRVLVLHVWADDDKDTFRLFRIKKLLPLRYLKIACNIAVKLPREIQWLQYLEILEVDATIVAIPWGIDRLTRLSSLKIAVRELSRKDILILQKLGALTSLSVDLKIAPTEWVVFGKRGFLVLNFFTFRCNAPRLLIKESAMPKIEKLSLCINAPTARQYGKKPIIIEHLASLKEITLKFRGAVADKGSALTNAVTNDARNPIPFVESSQDNERHTSGGQNMAVGIEVHMIFDLNNCDYAELIRLIIAEHVQGHPPVLGKQLFPKEPKRWMHIKLVAGMNETTLAVRDGNLNLVGFQANNGRWYELGFTGRSTRMLPASTFLECDFDYTDLLLVDHDDPKERNRLVREEMAKLELCRRSAIAAVSLLSGYNNKMEGAAADRDTRRALVSLMLMLCEATRMTPFFDTVLASWSNMEGRNSRIRKEDALYIWYWRKMSAALLEWEATGCKSWGPNETTTMLSKEINVKSGQEALSVVQVLLNTPVAANNTITRGAGRPLVEVFAVRAGSGVVVDTISVFDGRRGQTIYSHHASPTHIYGFPSPPTSPSQSQSQSQGTMELALLTLTGPYRGISADGSFAIQVDGISNEPASKVSADMFWDCYSHDKAVYNKVLTNRITTEKGQLAEVTYAVLSDAVEVAVQIKVAADDTAGFYGEITAHNQHYGGNSVLLFSRTEWEAKELGYAQEEEKRRRRGEEDVWAQGGAWEEIHHAREMARKRRYIQQGIDVVYTLVPLARSMVAVPFGSPLEIRVNLRHRWENEPLKEDMDFSLIDQHVGEIERHGVVVQVTSLDLCPLPEQSHIAVLPALPTTQVPGLTSTRTDAGMSTEQPERVYMDFNCGSGDYAAFMDDLCEKLADHPGKVDVHGRPVLARQRRGKPARLFMITLVGDKCSERVTLAVRDDNLLLACFKNQYGGWYYFRSIYWLEESTVSLGSDGSYQHLLGEAEDRWRKLELGRESAMDAVRKLSEYKDQNEVPEDTKRGLARLMVMICEAARFTEIYDTIKKGWDSGCSITERQIQYRDNWDNISRFLLGRRRRVRNIGLDREEDAAALVKMVLNPFHPLVEVIYVRAYPSFSGTISAVDEKGSKVIIYNKDHDAPSSQAQDQCIIDFRGEKKEEEDLPPTATYRPVSADGEVHIQVHCVPTAHSPRLTLVWDGHPDERAADEYHYNNLRRHRVTIAGSSAELIYAVLRNAVEATVKVQLNIKEHVEAGTVAGIYGEIRATNWYYWGKSILLFSHPMEEAVKPEVNASDAAVSIPLKLMRDFIAASLERVLEINVSLRAVCSSYEEPICFDQELRFDPNMGTEQTMKIDAPTMEAQVTFTTSG
ncbi:uncharacterized protein LOC123442630 isoform X3 [Hordeum vulgare subsp. vulgare]|uniref:uncharacterized protein LOC123442630 isoform X3 n=1 Tax=Hordeum vulgare subsp. vulgare TaxID=112509 RepID=UPI001D1A5825|nr:uncharacterized protein LOC123442630 isoform X3 [Hordeum vulgare subsp. vulgare]